jgi:UDP-glucose 4-epimerase
MKCLVTGGAGFVASHLVDALLAAGHDVVVYDHLTTGKRDNLANAMKQPKFGGIIEADVLDLASLTWASFAADWIFHFAAHADVSANVRNIRRIYEQNTLGTFNVLEAARTAAQVTKVVLASTGSVYASDGLGKRTLAGGQALAGEGAYLQQTSLYSASKIAGEAMLEAYAENFGVQAYIYRFVSMLGPRYSHGFVLNYLKQLAKNRDEFVLWGDPAGPQIEKAYIHVQDAAAGVLVGLNANEKVNIFNVGLHNVTTQEENARTVIARLGLATKLTWDKTKSSWTGDNPYICLDSDRLRLMGWQPKYNIQEAIDATVDYLATAYGFEGAK